MADKGDVNIKISTQGDTKGAEKVAKSLDRVEKSATKAGKAGAASGSKFQKLFPTFTRLGGKLKGISSLLRLAGGPWTILAAAAVAAIGKIKKEIDEWKARLDDIEKRSAEALPNIRSQLKATDTEQTRLTKAVRNFSEAQSESIRVIGEKIEALREEADDLRTVREAENEAAKAVINLAVVKGEMTEVDGEVRKSSLDAAGAEKTYREEVALLNRELKIRNEHAARSAKTSGVERDKANDADAALQLFERSTEQGKANLTDPSLNKRVKNAGLKLIRTTKKREDLKDDPSKKEEFERFGKFQADDKAALAEAQTRRKTAIEAEQLRLQNNRTRARERASAAQTAYRTNLANADSAGVKAQRKQSTGRSIFEAQAKTRKLEQQRDEVLQKRAQNAEPTPTKGPGSIGDQIENVGHHFDKPGAVNVNIGRRIDEAVSVIKKQGGQMTGAQAEDIIGLLERAIATVLKSNEAGKIDVAALSQKLDQVAAENRERRNQRPTR